MKIRNRTFSLFSFTAILLTLSCQSGNKTENYTTWSSYLGGPDRNHYSVLDQITLENVSTLEVAWQYDAPDVGQMQMNPIVVDTLLFGVTAALKAIALNAATGEEIWRFGDSDKQWHSTSRGVAYWENGDDKRILYTAGEHLYALNALTGELIPSFGDSGKVDLHNGLPEHANEKFVVSNTPGTIYNDLIVMPIRVGEDVGSAPGNIIAFNVISGAVEWVFHTIPKADEPGIETWENENSYYDDILGASNNWAGMAVDEETGVIYVPTGSASPDFYGGTRKGANLYANCLLALEANSGKLLWHFQFTHHDIWDRDLPAPPNLISVERDGKKVKAIAQITKQGYVYVFDRKTGEPLFDIKEVPVAGSNLDGEEAWPTQPIPEKPKPFARQVQDLNGDAINPYSKQKAELQEYLKEAKKGLYQPFDTIPDLLLPGFDGAAEWGGAGADPDEGILYVNSNEMAWKVQMIQNTNEPQDIEFGELVYRQNCAICHQLDRSGIEESNYPSLLEIKDKLSKPEIAQLITNGKGMMPGFPQITSDEKEALIAFLYEQKTQLVKSNVIEAYPLPYKFGGYKKFVDEEGMPGISPPWGTLHAINLNTGDYKWSIPLGDTPALKAQGLPQTGCENYGGPVITKNGLLFIAATKDGLFRAFNKHTGELLWEYKLPAAAFATPAMYKVNGKQYIALACGGEKLGTEPGNKIIAFSL